MQLFSRERMWRRHPLKDRYEVVIIGAQGDDCLGVQCAPSRSSEPGNDFLKTHDNVSGNDIANGGDNTDTCRIDAGDEAIRCEL